MPKSILSSPMSSLMPLEMHAFLHHAVRWPLAGRLRDQPTKRLRDKTVAAFRDDIGRRSGLLLKGLRKRIVGS